MDERKIGFFPSIYYSMAGFANYKYLLKHRTGRVVAYLLFITFILGMISLIPAVSDYTNVIDEMTGSYDSKVPDFVFENGRLDVQGEMPIIISDGGATVIIDTSGNTDESVLDNYDTGILITADRMIQKNYANKRVTDFSMLQGFKTDKAAVKKMIPLLKLVAPLILIFGSLFFIAIKFLSALVISLVGLIINASRNTNLRFGEIFRLSAYSMTLPLVLGTLLDLVPYRIPMLWAVFYIISIVYLWGAINTIKKDMDMELPPLPPVE